MVEEGGSKGAEITGKNNQINNWSSLGKEGRGQEVNRSEVTKECEN